MNIKQQIMLVKKEIGNSGMMDLCSKCKKKQQEIREHIIDEYLAQAKLGDENAKVKLAMMLSKNGVFKKHKKDLKIKKNKCMPENLYRAGLPIEWYNEHVDENGVFTPSEGIVEFLKRKSMERW